MDNNELISYIINKINNISISIHEIILNNNNHIYTFLYNDTVIKMYLPYVYDDNAQTIITTHTFHEKQMLDFVSQFIDPSRTILDIGANMGNHTIYFSKILHANKIIAFEPQKTMQEIFEKNMELNNIHNVTFNKFPLSDKNQPLSIVYFYTHNFGGTRFAPSDSGGYKAQTLDSLNLQDVQFVKMDVEEHELNVLQGGEKLFTEQKPKLWIEIRDENPKKKDVLELLDKYQYKCVAVMSAMDYLYFPK